MPPDGGPGALGGPGFRSRRLGVTSLIDVIFLLLLFFMLSSTFSRFFEIDLGVAAGGGAAAEMPPLFLRLGPDSLDLNGAPVGLDGLAPRLEGGGVLVVSLREGGRGAAAGGSAGDPAGRVGSCRDGAGVTGALAPPAPRRKPDATIALINVVFLMLIFFLIAGRIAPSLDGVALVDTAGLEPARPPDALVLTADGRLTWQGDEVSAAAHLAGLAEGERTRVRLVPDRAVPAARLVEVASALRTAGAGTVALVTEAGL